MGRLIAIMTILVIASCASPSANKKMKLSDPLASSTRPTYNLAGYRPAFKEGYIDGCETAKKSSYGLKDEKRFVEENQYRNGWKDGYNLCLGKK
jgi:hypothetical protein